MAKKRAFDVAKKRASLQFVCAFLWETTRIGEIAQILRKSAVISKKVQARNTAGFARSQNREIREGLDLNWVYFIGLFP